MPRSGVLVLAILGLLLPAVLAPPTRASHDPLTLPLRGTDARTQAALDWFGTRDDGCVHHPGYEPQEGSCPLDGMKWIAVMVASVGIDPGAWPRPDAGVQDWLMANADRTREEGDCTPDSPNNLCRQQAVMSRAKSILAYSAVEVDPRHVPVPGGHRDLVEELLRWYRNGQFGGSGFVSDDIFALIALNTIDHTDDRTRSSADFVTSTQSPDGGIGWEVGDSASPEMTGVAIAALAPRDRPAFVDDALAYLETTQNRTGPWRACWDRDSPDPGNTAWALHGLIAAGEDPLAWSVDGRSPTECLGRFQTTSGGFRSSRDGGASYIATHEAVTALSWAPYGTATGTVEPARETREMQRSGVTIRADPGFFRIGSSTRSTVTLPYGQPRPDLHGFTFSPDPHPVEVRVEPKLPTAPTIDAPRRVPHGQPVQITLAPGGEGTSSLALGLPNGTERRGPDHTLTLDAPGEVTVTARAVNAIGETGPTTRHRLVATNRPPAIASIDVSGPARARGEATLLADVHDPDGDPVEVRWRIGDQAADGSEATVRLPTAGPLTVRALAEDPWGADTTRTTVLHVAPPPDTDDADAPPPAGPSADASTEPVRPTGGRTPATPAPPAGLVLAALALAWGWRRWT